MRKGLVLLLLAFCTSSVQAVELEFIGPGAGFQDVSANGAKVLLFDYQTASAYIWTAEEGLVFIGASDANSPIYEISGDGKSVVGTMEHAGIKQASLWRDGEGWQGLGGSPTGCTLDNQTSSGWGVSGDGSVAVGLAWSTVDTFCRARAFRWTEENGVVLLHTPGDGNSRASAVSVDGQVAVGWTETDFGTWRPTRWEADGTEQLLDPDPEYFSEAIHVNADGSVVVGELERHAFRWTEAGGVADLGLVPGVPGPLSRAVGVSADGNTIVGWGGSPPAALNGFVWTETGGMQNLDQIVADAGIDLGLRFVSHATAVNADGSVIVGAIYNPTNFSYEAYRMRIAPPSVPPIPDGRDPADDPPLRIAKVQLGGLRLSWSPTCLGSETDYGVYEGTLGDFTSHTAVACSTQGMTETVVNPSTGDSYFLVVPHSEDYEASYGTDSEDVERPVGATACATQRTSGSCDW